MAKTKSPKISIITPVYNADLYLEECLNSLVNQTLQDIEIICVNDNSKDKSLKILENFSKKDKRIKIINFEQTCGQSRARNVALEQTSGKYIGFVDADDFVDPDMFEKMYKKAQNSDIVMCQAKVFDDKVKTYKDDAYFALDCFDDKFAEKPFTHEDTKDFATEINVSVWNKIYRAEFLKKSGVKFKEGFIYEDLPYFYEVYTQAKKVVLLKEFLYSYRINNQNSTMTRTDKNVQDRVDMISLSYDILKKQKYFEEIKSNVLNTIIHDLFYRCLIIDSRYQKEYFFRMQKFFRTLDTTDVDDTLIKSRYYPHFCEIKKRSYDEIVKYFFNQETLGAAYVEHAKKVFKRDFDRLETEKSEIAKNSEILKKSKSTLDKNWKDFEKEKQSQLDEISRRWSDFEKNKKSKLAELDKLQAKILQDEKNRYAEFEKQNNAKVADFDKQKEEIAQEWAKIDSEREKRLVELDKLQDKILQDEKARWADFEQKSRQKEEEISAQQAELDAAWEKYKKDSAEREKNLDEMQDKILTDEKERWSKFEEETSLKKSELIEREKALTEEFEQKKQALKKFEDEHWEKINARQEELKKAEYELDKAWEKFKIDNLTREKELDGKQAEILSDEKERWKKYELQVADFERQKVEFAKEKELALKEIDRQWSDFEKEKQLQLCEIDRQHKFEKLTIEKTKNYLSNKYLSEIEEEKVKLAKNYAEEISASKEYFSDLMQKQLKIQEENYRKTDIFKEKIKEEMMQRPKVSIILPVYNVAPYLKQSLDSIISQTLTDIEIICVDDGSTDESGKILDEYKEKDARIKVIHKKNAGTGAARNDGLKIATGECIGFVDPDDWILPNMYERLYNILQDKELDIVMFTPDVFNDQTQKHEGFLYFQDSNFPKILDDKIFNKDDISPFSYPMCVWNKLYRKKLFDENNIDFAEGLDFEDHKVIFKSLFTAKRIYFIREKLYVYRHSRKGSILSDNDTRMFDHIKIYDIVENILKETGNWEKFHLDFLRYKVHNILYYYTMIKPQYKDEYYKKMAKSLQNTQMSEEEFETLSKDYPDLKPIMGDTLANKIKNAVKKIIKRK